MKHRVDLFNVYLSQGWKVLSGPILLFFIPIFLSDVEQGYWYTFVSLSALAVLANLGFSIILLQFSAHEFAHLSIGSKGFLVGDELYISRLSSLWKYSVSWCLKVGLLAFSLIIIFGSFFLSVKESGLDWGIPWLIYGVASLIVFWNSMALSFFEGLDDVGGSHKIRFKVGLSLVASTIFFLYFDFGLYSLSLSLLFSSILGACLIYLSKRKLCYQFSRCSLDPVEWSKEIMPLLKKYSISWVSGYFIFQAITPITFYFFGPVEAGKVGLTIAIFYAIFSVSSVWLIVVTPKINMFISRKNFKDLNLCYKKSLSLTLIFYMIGASVFILFVNKVDSLEFIAIRIVPMTSVYLIALGWFFNVGINSMAIYVRAHKVEPFVIVSLINAVYVVVTTMVLAKYFSFDLLFLGFSSSYVIFSFFFYKIFRGFYLSNSNAIRT